MNDEPVSRQQSIFDQILDMSPEEQRALSREMKEVEKRELFDPTYVPPPPACWSWPLPDPEWTREREIERLMTRADPLSRGAAELVTSSWPRTVFSKWHDGRCACCGQRGEHLVDDHDHFTGRIRGLLCRGCNIAEGQGRRGPMTGYRERPPAAILGYEEYYTGRGWPYGWWENWQHAWNLTGNEAWLPPAELEKWRNRPDINAMGMLG